VTLGTLGVVGATVGLSAVARSANSELEEMAFALRSLDQSYSIQGMTTANAKTAGSSYTQKPVEEAHAELRKQIERDRKAAEKEAAASSDDKEAPQKAAPKGLKKKRQKQRDEE
jgi:hypothetical protein